SLAVPPVETSSTPNSASLRAKSTSPDLSVTLRMARWILDMSPSGAKRDFSSLGGSSRFSVLSLRGDSALLYPARVGTGALARPSRAQLGSCRRPQQLWIRYMGPGGHLCAMRGVVDSFCGASRRDRTMRLISGCVTPAGFLESFWRNFISTPPSSE